MMSKYLEMSDEELTSSIPPEEVGEDSNDLPEDLDTEEPEQEDLDSLEEDTDSGEELEDPEEEETPEGSDDSDGVFDDSNDNSTDDTEENQEPVEKDNAFSDANANEFISQVLKPFKANGKEVTPRSAEDVINLMKMGANYTKKMQDIAPYRKTLVSLEKLDLLDENKLNYLIDLHNKKPEAIKQLLKDSEFDPMEHDFDLDDEGSPEYIPSDNMVSEKEARLDEIIDNVNSLDNGPKTLSIINETWDSESKKVLWDSPELLETIHTQLNNGIYSQITQEVERMRVLGQIPAHATFLQAYRTVGDKLNEQGAFKATPNVSPRPTAVTKGKSKANANNGERAKSASITRGNPQKGKGRIVDLTDTSDDDFMKEMAKLI